MDNMSEKQSVNFLRGVPSEEALSHIIPLVSEGYKEVVRRYGTDVLQYGHFTGFKILRDSIGNLHNVNAERVMVGNGGLEVISLFFKSLPRESHIIVEEVSYDRVLLDAKNYGHKLLGVRLTSEGIDLNHLKELVKQARAKVFYGIPFHQNPTGINYTKDNRKAVELLCRENDILCVWDICYQDLRYDGKVNEPIEISGWGPIITSSFTKTISPGSKCGYIIVPDHYVKHLSGIILNTRINPNLPTQAFIADFIKSGRYDDNLKYLCNLYKPRMNALNSALNTMFPEAHREEVTGGFFVSLNLDSISIDNEAAFIESAKKGGVGIAAAWDAVAPNFVKEKQKKGLFFRLTFPSFQPNEIEWGISKLKETSELFS